VTLPKYAVTSCEVDGRREYGLLVHSVDTEEKGYVDRADVGDFALPESEWPSNGSRVRCVVLGYARAGRLRLSLRPRDLALADSVDDVRAALRHWIHVRDLGQDDPIAMEEFLSFSYAVPVLRWAVNHSSNSRNHNIAMWGLGLLPPEVAANIVQNRLPL